MRKKARVVSEPTLPLLKIKIPKRSLSKKKQSEKMSAYI
ncbi:hypothetical protein C2W64_02828 [Brevibacillus laterosporus]|nr:hypothetical protein C2W64_02828 [Brevibacillus laterosporus]